MEAQNNPYTFLNKTKFKIYSQMYFTNCVPFFQAFAIFFSWPNLQNSVDQKAAT